MAGSRASASRRTGRSSRPPERFGARAAAGGAQFTWRAWPTFEALTLEGAPGLRVRVGQLDERLGSAMAGVPGHGHDEPAGHHRDGRALAAGEPDRGAVADRAVRRARRVCRPAQRRPPRRASPDGHGDAPVAWRRPGPDRRARPRRRAAADGARRRSSRRGSPRPPCRAFNVAGPLAEIGLRIHPVVSGEAYLAAGAAAAVVPGRPAPAGAAHGPVLRVRPRQRRPAPRRARLGTRLGLDLALLAVAGLGLWQLRHYGAPLTRSVQGSLGIDPLLVATPAIGFLAGAILALRVIPLVADPDRTRHGPRARPRLVARGAAARPTAAALHPRGVAADAGDGDGRVRDHLHVDVVGVAARSGELPGGRRRARGTRTRGRRAAALGAGPRVRRGAGPDRAHAHRTRAGADRRERCRRRDRRARCDDGGVRGRPATRSRRPRRSPSCCRRWPRNGRRSQAVPLPGEPRALHVDVGLAIDALQQPEIDEVTGELEMGPVDPALFADTPAITTSVVVRDAAGHLHRFGGDLATLGGSPHRLGVPLGDADGRRRSRPSATRWICSRSTSSSSCPKDARRPRRP